MNELFDIAEHLLVPHPRNGNAFTNHRWHHLSKKAKRQLREIGYKLPNVQPTSARSEAYGQIGLY